MHGEGDATGEKIEKSDDQRKSLEIINPQKFDGVTTAYQGHSLPQTIFPQLEDPGSQLQSSEPSRKHKKGLALEDNVRLIEFKRRPKTSSKVIAGFDVTLPTNKPDFHFKTFLLEKFPCAPSYIEEKSAGMPDLGTESHPIVLSEESDEGAEQAEKGHDKRRKTRGTRDQPLGKAPPDSDRRNAAAGKKSTRKGTPQKNRITNAEPEHVKTPVVHVHYIQEPPVQQTNTKGGEELMSKVHEAPSPPPAEVSIGNKLEQVDGRNDSRTEKERTVYKVDLSTAADYQNISRRMERNQEGSPHAVNYKCHQDILVNRLSTEGHSTSQIDTKSRSGTSVKCPGNRMVMCTVNSHFPYNEDGGKAHEESLPSSTQVQAASALTCPIAEKMPCWQFEKNSVLWEIIGSMEEISKLPQQPHFRPLSQLPELSREGEAIGLMVTCNNLLEAITELKIDHPHCKFDESMKTLKHLQGYGFDLRDARAQLEEKMKLKNELDQLVKRSFALRVLKLEKENERHELNSNIDKIGATIKDAEDKLVELYKREASNSKQQEDNNKKIANLGREANTVKERIQSAENNFQRLASSP